MADDDIKPDAPETAAAAGDVAAAAGDAPVPREPEEGEVAEAAEDATGAEEGAPEPEASATSESVAPPQSKRKQPRQTQPQGVMR